jgi:hypothetical protein
VTHIQLTAPVKDMTELANRPGTLHGTRPADPKPEANTSDCYEATGKR